MTATSVPVRGSGCFDKSASEYRDAIETDNPVKYLKMKAIFLMMENVIITDAIILL
jgi:hypothetical protein